MATNKALIEKRKELKRRLVAGEYKTMVDVFLAWIDQIIQKFSRRSEPSPTWFVILILIFSIFLAGYVSVVVTGEWYGIPPMESFGYYGTMITFILVGTLAIISPVLINQYLRRIFALWHDEILDSTESLESLDWFEEWLGKVCNRRVHLWATIFGALGVGSFIMFVFNEQAETFAGYGFMFTFFILSMFSAAFLHLFIMVVSLSANLRNYNLKLFAADPSSSKIINHLSNELNFVSLLVAIYAALLTLIAAWGNYLSTFGAFVVLFLWLPIIAMFILNQTSLSSIVRRAKWNTLNEIQTKVEKLQSAKNFETQTNMDTINRLLDYHDRVKGTRNSSLSLRTVLSFINSLLLPLLAFILGNLDLVLNLFTDQP